MEENMAMEGDLDYRAIGRQIKKLRMSRSLSQIALARALGLSQAHMSNIESGRAGVTLENLVKMSTLMNCTIDEIVFGVAPVKQQESASTTTYTAEDIIQAVQVLKLLKSERAREEV